MRVQRVLAPGSMVESWTLLGDDLRPVDPVESFLAYLAAIERSPNTIKAYAHDLKDWWVYLDGRGLGWQRVDLEAGCIVGGTSPRTEKNKRDGTENGWLGFGLGVGYGADAGLAYTVVSHDQRDRKTTWFPWYSD